MGLLPFDRFVDLSLVLLCRLGKSLACHSLCCPSMIIHIRLTPTCPSEEGRGSMYFALNGDSSCCAAASTLHAFGESTATLQRVVAQCSIMALWPAVRHWSSFFHYISGCFSRVVLETVCPSRSPLIGWWVELFLAGTIDLLVPCLVVPVTCFGLPF
jgi:hypothetical protein